MAQPKPVTPYQTFQGGDGKRYALHIPMIRQIAESCAAAEAKNKHSSLQSTYSPSGWFGRQVEFKNVHYDRKSAEAFIKRAGPERLGAVWQAFASPGGGAAMSSALLTLRHRVKTHTEALAEKFAASDEGNKASLKTLDDQVYWSKFVRDNGLTAVAVLATGGTTIYAGAAASALTLKTGLRVNDMRVAGTLGNGMEIASVTMDAATDAFFCVLAPALGAVDSAGKAAMSTGQKMIIALFVKAPIEGAKTAMNGGNLNQIMLSVALEGAGPMVDHLKDYIGDTLLPMFTKPVTTTALDAGLAYAKDKASGQLGLPGPPARTAGELLTELKNFVMNFGMSEADFIRRYVVVPA